MKVMISEDTGVEQIALTGSEIDNSIRLRFDPRKKEMSVIANTKVGYLSADLKNPLKTRTPPWNDGVLVTSGNGATIELSSEQLKAAQTFLEDRGFTFI